MSDAVLECPTSETKPKLPDWELAKTLYLSFVPTEEIMAKAGVSSRDALYKQTKRKGWAKIRQDLSTTVSDKVNKVVQVVTQTTTVGDQALQNSSNSVRNSIGKRLEKQVIAMAGKEVPKSLKAIKAEQDVLESVVRNGRVVFGWDSQSASTMLSISSLESMHSPAALDCPSTVTPEPVQNKACLNVPALPDQAG